MLVYGLEWNQTGRGHTGVRPMRVALVSAWRPRPCPVAAFSAALSAGLEETGICEQPVRVVAASRYPGEASYGSEVVAELCEGDPNSYREAAEVLNGLGVDAVLLQHEAGLYGAQDGYAILDFARRLEPPLVTVVHSVRPDPTPTQRHVLIRLARRSRRVVALSSRARGLLESVYAVPAHKTALIPRGVQGPPPPEVVARAREQIGAEGRPVVVTPTVMGPGQGLELALEAIRLVRPAQPDLLYVVIGGTEPGERAARGETYRDHLQWWIRRLGLEGNVLLVGTHLSEEELLAHLALADVVLLPAPRTATGAAAFLPQVLALGKPVVSTPFGEAVDFLAGGAGVLVNFGNAESMARSLEALLTSPALRQEVGRKALARRMTAWPDVARQYGELLRATLASRPAR